MPILFQDLDADPPGASPAGHPQHRAGRLAPEQIDRWRQEPAVPCTSPRGGALVMRPLILHASSPSTLPAHRRVVHLEFAADPLPHGLEWHGRW
jgi:hypothetical protein